MRERGGIVLNDTETIPTPREDIGEAILDDTPHETVVAVSFYVYPSQLRYLEKENRRRRKSIVYRSKRSEVLREVIDYAINSGFFDRLRGNEEATNNGSSR